MVFVDKSYGRLPVVFPTTPYISGGLFAAYITCYRSPASFHAQRLANFHKQLRWWRLMTDIPVHVIASGWTRAEIDADAELALLAKHGGSVILVSAQDLILNRIHCLEALYASDHAMGIVMDDDAILYDSPAHNSGAAFFAEMARNGIDAYDGVDVFFPINGGKQPGQNAIWSVNPARYSDNHVFSANYDLKGSLFAVRNFPRFGRQKIVPPSSFRLHGEDTLFAIEAISGGCTVFRCDNIVLKEFAGQSHFLHTKAEMETGNTAIASMYAGQGLRMNTSPARAHLLDRSVLLARCLTGKSKEVVVRKPQELGA